MSLLRRIELYLKQSGTAPARFGRDAVGDPNLMRDLRNGRELRARTAERLTAFLATWEARDAAPRSTSE
ncbi:hypothetical protein [Sphingomonas sp.]|uniref:hypothetical protein n=1 Tax=Sphingomonas sp. TaxID=28214 RepID=UPI002FC77CAF